MDLKKLSRAEQIICASGIVLLIMSFFKWYKVDTGGQDVPDGFSVPGVNGWDLTLGWLAVIIGIVMVAQILLSKFSDVKLPDLGSVSWGQVHMILGAVAAVFLLIRLIDTPGIGGFDRTIWLFVAFVAALGLAAGGYLKMQEEKAGGGALPPRPPAA